MRVMQRLFVTIATLLLLALSSSPASVRATPRAQPLRLDAALAELRECFPQLASSVAGCRVLDFGCGEGRQAIALAHEGAIAVTGVELSADARERAAALASAEQVSDRVRFIASVDRPEHGRYDVCISQNSMEHFSDPLQTLREMRACLRPGGLLLVTFSPPWYAPYGAHMAYFTRIPWVHLLFPEQAVMAVRSRYRDDGARRYEDVNGGLNRMSLAKFERVVAAAGLEVAEQRNIAVRNLPLVTRIPLLRELMTNRVTATLRVPVDQAQPGSVNAPRQFVQPRLAERDRVA